MIEELKPCPFCGGADIEYHEYTDVTGYRCVQCEAAGPYTEYRTKEKAAILWNTRTTDKQSYKAKGDE